MELQKRNFNIDPSEMIYHKDRFLTEGKCEMVRFVGAFHGEYILTNEIEVVCRGNELGKIARFVVRSGDQEVDLVMDLETCRYEAEGNIKTKLNDVVLVFEAQYKAEEVVPA
uniref:Uncharacterized protein n=1 Tax=Pseudomonas phage RVTF4 TaxID=3236931 RepID=A0AB39CC57_9VIRU